MKRIAALLVIILSVCLALLSCDKKEEETKENYPSEHAHSYKETITLPTDHTRGYTTYTCECGDSYVVNYIERITISGVELTLTEEKTAYYVTWIDDNDKSLVIPENYNGLPVIAISSIVFLNHQDMTSINLPASVVLFDHSDIMDCNNLNYIKIDENHSLYKSIDGNLYTKDGKTLLRYAPDKKATSFSIPEGVTRIEEYAFSNANNLTSIVIPDSVTSIRKGAFSHCNNLADITIPDSVTSIGAYAFAYCNNLTSVTMPDSVSAIGSYAFSYCEKITHLDIPNGISTIIDFQFANCSNLESITIPDSVTSIGRGAFLGCKSLVEITIPNSVTDINSGAFSGCESLVNVTLPDSITYLPPNIFSGCTMLAFLVIPDGVRFIHTNAFSRCVNLRSIVIPESVSIIYESAFADCTELANIYFRGTEEKWSSISRRDNWNYNTGDYTITYNYANN